MLLPKLANIISASIKRKDTDSPVFCGCYDWHSAVHGHWALLRLSVALDDRPLRQLVLDSLDVDLLSQESALIVADTSFEMPYGRAWFLTLALEMEKCCDDYRLRPLADVIAESLLAHVCVDANVNTLEYSNHSWALIQLFKWYCHTQQEEEKQKIIVIVADKFLVHDLGCSFSSDSHPSSGFFSLFGNAICLVSLTQDSATLNRFLQLNPISDVDLAPIIPKSCHHLGMNWSRATALRCLAEEGTLSLRDRGRFARACITHWVAGMSEFEQHSGRYDTYDHWVPQFAVYALTKSNECMNIE